MIVLSKKIHEDVEVFPSAVTVSDLGARKAIDTADIALAGICATVWGLKLLV